MVRSPAVNAFVEAIGATKDRSFAGNLFQFQKYPLIVKGDDKGRQFWGVPAKLCGRFDIEGPEYFIVLLNSGNSGWLFTGEAFRAQVQAGRYTVAPGQTDYKIGGGIDGAVRFHNLDRFRALIDNPIPHESADSVIDIQLRMPREVREWFSQETGEPCEPEMVAVLMDYVRNKRTEATVKPEEKW